MLRVGSQVRSLDGTVLGEVIVQSGNKIISFVKLASHISLDHVGPDRVVGIATKELRGIPEEKEEKQRGDF